MNICIISFFSPQTSAGGLERYLDTTMKELSKRRHSIHFVTASYGKDGIEKIGNIAFHKLKAMNLRTRNKNQAAKKLFNYLKRLIKNEKIDIISAENFYRGISPAYAFAVNLASMETKTPIVLRMHGHFKREIEKSLIKDLFWGKIMPVSKNVSSETYHSGVNVGQIETVYPPIDTEFFKPGLGKEWLRSRIQVGKEDIIILHASRITGSKRYSYLEEKGILTLIKAFSTLIQNHKDIKLLIATALPPPIWKKDYEKACKKIQEFAELNGLKDKIIIQPFKLEEMPLVYNGADIFAMASRMESFGLVYAEALACGIPTVGTSVGGIPEIIDNGKIGYLVQPNDPVELAKRIDYLINNPKKRKLMGWKGRKVIEKRFALKKISDNYLGILNSVIGKTNNKKTKNKKKENLNKFLFLHTFL